MKKHVLYWVFLAQSMISFAQVGDSALIAKGVLRITLRVNDTLSVSGTAWFIKSNRQIATVAHVIDTMRMSRHRWTPADLLLHNGIEKNCEIKLQKVFSHKNQDEKMVLLKLRERIDDILILKTHRKRIPTHSLIYCIGYPHGILRYAEGIYHGTFDDQPRMGLFETYNGNQRLVMDFGASGSPILNQDNKVVAVLCQSVTQNLSSILPDIDQRVSTPWGNYNNLGVLMKKN